MSATILDEPTYTPAEAAPKLKQKVSTIWTWCRTGKIKAPKIGHGYQIPESELVRIKQNGTAT
jgi:excisionase family DNA binding protein